MALLTYSSTYSSSDSLFLVTFWDLILCQTSSHVGSSHGVLIGKRLVGNMNIESEVRFCLLLGPYYTNEITFHQKNVFRTFLSKAVLYEVKMQKTFFSGLISNPIFWALTFKSNFTVKVLKKSRNFQPEINVDGPWNSIWFQSSPKIGFEVKRKKRFADGIIRLFAVLSIFLHFTFSFGPNFVRIIRALVNSFFLHWIRKSYWTRCYCADISYCTRSYCHDISHWSHSFYTDVSYWTRSSSTE